MEFIVIIFVFLFGSIIGSFLNVCIYRIPNEESIAFPPSHCGSCGENLKSIDLIPIFSYCFLRGKCRYCKSKVSIQYPLVEAFTGLLYVIIYFKFGFSLELAQYMFFTSLLIVIAIIDFKTQDVYTSTIITGIIGGIIFSIIKYFYYGNLNIINVLLAAIIPSLIIWLIVYFTGAMGEGDVEILFFVGLFINFKLSLFNLFLSIVLGGIAAIILMLRRKKTGKDTMAFGPYIAISSYITILCGNEVLNWYIGTFF